MIVDIRITPRFQPGLPKFTHLPGLTGISRAMWGVSSLIEMSNEQEEACGEGMPEMGWGLL